MKNKRALLVSCSVILLCMSIIVGMTYALFTEKVSVIHHLKAGGLDVRLTRTGLEYTILDDDGVLQTVTKNADADKIDLTDPSAENVFGLGNTETLIVPGSYFTATMELANDADIAFAYSVSIKLIEASNAAIKDQLQVTVTHPDGNKTVKKLSECTGGLSIATGTMTPTDDMQSFSVEVKFLDVDGNNNAQEQTVVFDLIVEAEQATA